MYAPAWPGLCPSDLLQPHGAKALTFPLSAPYGTYFYRARNAIFHLFRALRFQPGDTVLVPAYHSGNEVWAMRAAGAAIRYYSINRQLQPDLDEVGQLCKAYDPRALFVIHFLGWPQPMQDLTALCQERDMILVEDCALALLSETGGQPLGTFGDYAIFCLYKTLPIPNGGLLVQNRRVLENLTRLALRPCGMASVAARSAELLLEWLRSRYDRLGKALFALKRALGQSLSTLRVQRVPVGEIGFDLAHVDIAMSSLCHRLFRRFDYEKIRRRRRDNFLFLQQKLAGRVPLLCQELDEGVCPLFFPILVPDKHAAARALWQRGIAAVEFWNYGDPEADGEAFPEAQFLREHVLELPIHQEITPAQVEYMADEVLRLKLAF